MNKLLISRNAIKSEIIMEKLLKKFDVEFFDTNELESMLTDLENFSVWIHFDTLITDNFIKFQDSLQYLITTTTGTTHISPNFRIANERKIISLESFIHKMSNISSTAEHAWALMMAFHHKISEASESVNSGNWNRDHFIRCRQLRNSTIGIIGFGRLGKITKKYAESFGANILVNELRFDKNPRSIFQKIDFVSLTNLLEKSDYVFIHASANENTNPIITKEILHQIKTPFVLINTSRGRLVDETAVLEYVDKGIIKAYLADVLKDEDENVKITNSKLLSSKANKNRIVITPHIGGASLDAMFYCENLLYLELIRRLKI